MAIYLIKTCELFIPNKINEGRKKCVHVSFVNVVYKIKISSIGTAKPDRLTCKTIIYLIYTKPGLSQNRLASFPAVWGSIVLVLRPKNAMVSILQYSQTCIRRSLGGPIKCGRHRQVAVLQKVCMKLPYVLLFCFGRFIPVFINILFLV